MKSVNRQSFWCFAGFVALVPAVLWAQAPPPIHEEVNFKSIDGMKIYGNLYRPKGNGPFPAIVRVHGGLHGQAQSRRQDYFVDNGYVVLDVDYRGSEGHGKDYRNKLTMADKELDDVLAAAKFLQTLPVVQKEKLAIMGDSRGGYITYSVIARQNPFKAAVAISGFTDLIKQYEYEAEIAPNFMQIQKLMKGSPYTMEEKFKDLSPVSFASRINVPVLLLHGNNDRLVLPDHAWKMAEALFLHQKEHDIIVLYSPEEDTGHNLKGKALEQAHEQSLKWLNKYLFPENKK
ncbi:MAG: prolyl oligopeptidase family serine peptidase [Acidobacteria bacterium]|nr:prolyl oligopeptidase family serine peptidase [Acidobacteriota bacterium]MCI0620483.1 prolyl oligopeptidase family serine peptidase [Acidobacteriota bacterium]MCI0722945.1 prolyl oligopeptidase family serine peptidase [Acidobacteriota bacterium]